MPPACRPGRPGQPVGRFSWDCRYQATAGARRRLWGMATVEFGQAVRRWRDRVSPEAAGLPAGGHRRGGRAAPRGTGPAGRDLGRLRHPAGAGPGLQPVGAGRRGAGPGAAAVGGRARAPVPAGRAGAAGPGDGARLHHPERAAAARPADRDAGRGLRRGLDAAGGQPAVRGADGRPVRLARQRAQRGLAQPGRAAGQPGPAGTGGTPRIRGGAGRRPAHGLARYPADRRLRQLVADLRASSPRFAELWDSGAVGRHQAAGARPSTTRRPAR